MNAVEEIKSAIDKLTCQRDASTIGPWISTDRSAFDFAGLVRSTGMDDGFDDTIAHTVDLPDSDLIVTLHRTIDAQLAILTEEIPYARAVALFDDATALKLARAINGAV